MDGTRQDAWTDDEDIMLAETVLQYIREGKTQLEAFSDVARRLSRTSAACGFRWNATIRKQYDRDILFAKKERKKGMKNHLVNIDLPKTQNKDTLEAAISLLEQMKTNFKGKNETEKLEYSKHLIQLERKNDELNRKLLRYEQAWREMGNLWEWVQSKDSEQQTKT